MTDLNPTNLTKVKRAYKRGAYDRETINAILDATPLCHVAYVIDGQPACTPTLQWREGNRVYWHGSSASRAIKKSTGMDVCLTVSLFDGWVLARSGFHHSANYRSVMIYGRAEKVEDPALKAAHLKTFIEQMMPGRWDMLRPMSEKELKATTLLSLPITEASAKVRAEGVKDDEEDYALPIWAGVVPVTQTIGNPIPDSRNLDGVPMPDHVKALKIG